MREIEFCTKEYYHIFNRGVDKRDVFSDKKDLERFFQSMIEFNVVIPIGSIYENSFRKIKNPLRHRVSKLVNFVAYCLNPNHYHFILEPVVKNGIQKFMHRLGSGYTKYFNERHFRNGSLFQGAYKAIHVDSDDYLSYLSVYINFNNKIHKLKLGHSVSKSSLDEYIKVQQEKTQNDYICQKDAVLEQFNNFEEYKEYVREVLDVIMKNKKEQKELEKLLLE